MGKLPKQSKTYAFNLLMGMLWAATALLPMLDQLVALGVPQHIADKVEGVLLFITLIGNAYLRTVTKEPIVWQ